MKYPFKGFLTFRAASVEWSILIAPPPPPPPPSQDPDLVDYQIFTICKTCCTNFRSKLALL